MSELPLGWQLPSLNEVADVIRGVSYKKHESSSINQDGYLPVLRANNIHDGRLNLENLVYVKANNIKEIQKLQAGDVVIAMSSGSKKLVGKSGTSKQDYKGSFGAFCSVLRPSSELEIRFIGLFTRSKEYLNSVSVLSKGVNINNLKVSHFSEIRIPIPPLNEQIRIANKLDSLLAKVDKAQARLDKIPTLLKRFRKSVLAAATSGELTREWREALTTDEQWENHNLATLCNSVSDGDHQAPPKADEGIPFLVISNVSSGKIEFDKVSRWVPQSYFDELKSIRKPELNDILYTVTGSFGIPIIVNSSNDFCFQRHIAILKPKHDLIDSKYLSYFLEAPATFKHASEVATGTAQKTVSLTNLRNFVIKVPSIEEQKEIVHSVESLFTLAETVEKQYQNAKQRIDRLTQSILAKAFRGELVSQDPNDEPASELLKRIAAEREAQKPVKKTRKKKARVTEQTELPLGG